MTPNRVHVRKVIVFDYTLSSDSGNDMDAQEIVEILRSELGEDGILRSVDAFLEPWGSDTFTVKECVLTVKGDPLSNEDEERIALAAQEAAAALPGSVAFREYT